MTEKQQSRQIDMQRLFDMSVDMFGTAGLDGYFKTLNPAWEKTLGWTPDELRAKPFIEFVHPDDVEQTNAESARIADGAKILSFENRYRCKDGSYRWIGWTAVPYMDEGLLYFVARDITEHKQQTETLMRQQQLLDSILSSMPSGLMAVDVATGKTILSNQRAEEILGQGINPDVETEEMTDVYAAYRAGTQELYPLEELPLVRGMSGESTRIDDMEVEHPDGSRLLLEVVGSPVYDDRGNVIASVINLTDVTEQRATEREQQRLQQEVIEAQRQALTELSAPVIQIADGIIIMPLIGTIDTSRARVIMRGLLSGITDTRARTVILDITGVPLVDSGVADHLNRTIQAARLKGARTIITGVSDAVAETIVDLGIDWSKVETMRDLQSGLAVAMET